MDIRKIKFNLDLAKMGHQVNITGVRQGDTDSIQFVMRLTDCCKTVKISSDCIAIIYGTKPDGTKLMNRCEISEDGDIVYTLHSQDTAVAGTVTYQLEVSKKNNEGLKVLATPVFTCTVEPKVFNAKYTLLSKKPSDWAENYSHYYELVNGCYYNLTKPTSFIANLFYSCDGVIESTNEYGALLKAIYQAEEYVKKSEDLEPKVSALEDKTKEMRIEHNEHVVSSSPLLGLSSVDEYTLIFNEEDVICYVADGTVTEFSGGNFYEFFPDAVKIVLGKNVTKINGAFSALEKIEKVYIYPDNADTLMTAFEEGNSGIRNEAMIESLPNYSHILNLLMHVCDSVLAESIDTEKIADNAISMGKLKNSIVDEVSSLNLFNPENVINANINGTSSQIASSPSCRLGYVKCEPNTTYTIIRNGTLSSRFIYGYTTVIPEAGVTVNDWFSHAYQATVTYTTGADAKYLVFFFYIAKYDTDVDPAECAKNIMVAEETVTDFEPYRESELLFKKSVLPLDIQSLPDEVEALELATDTLRTDVDVLRNARRMNNRFNTKSKIYGVSFDCTSEDTRGTRIADSEELQTDYVVANDFQNGGHNDFDDIFPWCDIRRCNLVVNNDGTKKVVYEGENGFATDGSNGNVMVEIPKFYTFRENINGIETWAVTGEPKSGFTVEPAFLDNDGNELDYIYVGAYEFSGTSAVKNHSISGATVQTALTMANYRNIAKEINMTCMDYAILHSLQFLWVVEFADRDTDKYMQGVSHLPWFSSSNSPITAITDDRLTVTVDYSGARTKNLRVGQDVLLCQNSTPIQSNQKIVAINISADETTAEIAFDVAVTSIIEDITTGNYYIAGKAQNTGKTDNLSYHTGRISVDNALSPFRYRYIENLWGNTWTMLDGLRIKELDYYYTYDTSRYADSTVGNWNKSSFKAPNQPYLGDDGHNRAWISEMGYDVNDRQIVLPIACSADGATDRYYSSAFYSNYDVDRQGKELDTTQEYICVYGGGYDHNALCGLFTMRFWWSIGVGEQQGLHSSRLVCRR